jgi:hypothetical protein
MRFCGIVAATAIALSGIEIDTEIIDAVMEGVDDAVAETFLMAACFPLHSTLQAVNKIAYGQCYNAQLILKYCIMAAGHEEVRPVIIIALQLIYLSCLQDKCEREMQLVTVLVNC